LLSHHFLSCLVGPARDHDLRDISVILDTRRITMQRLFMLAALAALVVIGPAQAADADLTASLKTGTVELKSAGPVAFGPQGILFIGDPQAAAIHAIDTGDRPKTPDSTNRPKVEGIDSKIASLLGTAADQVRIADLAVNPLSGTTYLSVARGRGPDAAAVIVTLTPGGKLDQLSLKDVKSSTAALPNAAAGRNRQDAITHLAYVKGRVLVAGQSNEEFSSKLRAIPFPFAKSDAGTSIEIYHGAHGRFETNSPVRVFAHYKIGDQDHILAAYQCTPLVKIPVAQLKPGQKITGTTVAELGNRNRPLSMIVYKKGGKDYVLMANSARGLMKINLEGVDSIKGITTRISNTAGLPYDTIKEVKGVQKLDAFGKDHAIILVQAGKGKVNLETIALP
jgi:hypothetical protein